MRLDRHLVETGRFDSRARAQEAVKAGLVTIDGAVAVKASVSVPPGARVEAGDPHPYVSRGGVKLAAALDAFGVDPAGRVCLDLGASTGGFTDVLLRRGAARVYAVDVGRDQLHERIAADARVARLEETHADQVDADLVPEPVDLLVADVSFISLLRALRAPIERVRPGGALVALVKPQFEVGRAGLGKGGLARAAAAADALEAVRSGIDGMRGWGVAGVVESPLLGGDGNREHLLHACRDGGGP